MYSRRTSLTGVTLSLLGLCTVIGCGDSSGIPYTENEQLASTEQAIAVPLPELEPEPLPRCLEWAQLNLNHADGTSGGTSKVGTKAELVNAINQQARPGDLMEIRFGLAPGCDLDPMTQRLSLVSYSVDHGIEIMSMVPHAGLEKPAYDMNTGRFDSAGGALSVRLPPCDFEVAFAFGEPLSKLGAGNNSYEVQERLIASGTSANTSICEIPALAIQQFDTVGQAWGEAPVQASFGWKVEAQAGAQIWCSLDLDGDGQEDQYLDTCPSDTSLLEMKELPAFLFATVGKHQPELIVSDGMRRIWARTTVYANHLDYKPNVRFPEKVATFVSAALKANPLPESSSLTLQYNSGMGMPVVQVNDVVVGSGDSTGYMLRVKGVTRNILTKQIAIVGTPVNLDDVVTSGFLGLRDFQVSTAGARCISGSCEGTLTPVANPPAGPGGSTPILFKHLAADAPTLNNANPESKRGLKITVPITPVGCSDGVCVSGEAEFFTGIVVEHFELDWGFLSLDKAVIKLTPTLEVSAAIKAQIARSFDFGSYVVGALPLPLPLTIKFNPTLDVEVGAAMKATAKASTPFSYQKDDGGSHGSVKPIIKAMVENIDSTTEIGLKITAVPKILLDLGPLPGPYVAPTIAVVQKTEVKANCDVCSVITLEGGARFGWQELWTGVGEMFDPVNVTLAELELMRRCRDGGDSCPPPPPPPPDPPGGGAWGDVHMISFDGLLYDFQAGGEFVLVRATSGAPFEVQTRQEPMKKLGSNDLLQLGVSINTAVATMLDGHRVGFYTRMPSRLYIDGAPTTLGANQSVAVGAGTIAMDGNNRATLSYPSGDKVKVQLVSGSPDRMHYDVTVELAAGRAGHVVGLLGNADGDRSNDIGLADGIHYLPQPVSRDAMYFSESGNFAAEWRVATGPSWFESPSSIDDATLRSMPAGDAAPSGDAAINAQTTCASCPANLRDTCVLDVANTGDAQFAAACQTPPAPPAEVMLPSDGNPIAVSPRYGAFIDCADQKLVFRAPGAANADTYPTPNGLMFNIAVHGATRAQPYPINWQNLDFFESAEAPPGGAADWGTRLECHPIGDGSWGECTLQLDPATGPCVPRPGMNYFQWYVEVKQPGGNYIMDVAEFQVPVP